MAAARPPLRRALRAASILEELLEQRGMEQKLREYQAWQVWEQVVGVQIASHARPLRLREGVLEVRVDQPIWMQQLQLMAPQILAKLNRALGEELIRSIYWRRGSLKPVDTPAPPPQPFSLPPLTADESRAAEQAAAALADGELRQALGQLFKRQAQADKSRSQGSDQG